MKRIIIFSLIFGSIAAKAQDARKFSFSEAITFAEQNNTTYKNAQLDVNIAKETVKQTTSYGLPQVSASAGYQQYLTIPGNWVNNFTKVPGSSAPDYIFIRFQQEFASSANLSVSQLLFDGTYFVGLQATKAFMGMSELLKAKSLKDLQLNVAKAYVTAVSTQKNLTVIEANIALLEKSAYEVKEMNKEGFVESLDVDRLNFTLSNLYLQREKLQNAIIITGFQAYGSLGRRLVDKATKVRLFGEEVLVRASIHTIGGLSAHADQAGLLDWLKGFETPPKSVFVVHGEPESSSVFAECIRDELGWKNVIIPERLHTYSC